MKNFTLMLLVLIAFGLKTNAQIPNNGFESWNSFGNYEDPADWATMNGYCAGPFYSCTKSTDHYPSSVGSFSARIENNTSLTQQTGGWGFLVTDTMAYPYEPAFPITGNPTSLCGYYKYNSMNSDSMFIRIIFFASGAMIGNNTFVNGISATEWTAFTLPITPNSADSATIIMGAYWPTGPTSGPKGNSVLHVDNLSFDNLINSVSSQNLNAKGLSLYPNPANDFVSLNIDINLNEILTVNVYNAMGALVMTEILNNSQKKFNISELSNGIYIVELKSAGSVENTKLIIQR